MITYARRMKPKMAAESFPLANQNDAAGSSRYYCMNNLATPSPLRSHRGALCRGAHACVGIGANHANFTVVTQSAFAVLILTPSLVAVQSAISGNLQGLGFAPAVSRRREKNTSFEASAAETLQITTTSRLEKPTSLTSSLVTRIISRSWAKSRSSVDVHARRRGSRGQASVISERSLAKNMATAGDRRRSDHDKTTFRMK